MVTLTALQEVKAQFEFIYEKQTETQPSPILILYWTDYRLEAPWTISVLILIGFFFSLASHISFPNKKSPLLNLVST